MRVFSQYHPDKYSDEHYSFEKRIGWHAFFVSSVMVVVLWLIKLVEFEFGIDLSGLGILPGDPYHLKGVLFSPLIHAGFGHLAANSPALFILTFSLFFFYRNSAYTIFLLIYVLSGLLVWLGGREALHIGASGIIYGLAAFLFLSGVLSRNTRLLTISLIVAFLYGGLFWGIFPLKPEISWESHLWGGVSGFLLAWLFRSSAPLKQVDEADEEDEADDAEWRMESGDNDIEGDTPDDTDKIKQDTTS
jgi:membrane associated rhomboid family serine protease